MIETISGSGAEFVKNLDHVLDGVDEDEHLQNDNIANLIQAANFFIQAVQNDAPTETDFRPVFFRTDRSTDKSRKSENPANDMQVEFQELREKVDELAEILENQRSYDQSKVERLKIAQTTRMLILERIEARIKINREKLKR